MVAMLAALRFEVRANTLCRYFQQRADVADAWQVADLLAKMAEEELQHGEQETEAGIRKNWVDTAHPA